MKRPRMEYEEGSQESLEQSGTQRNLPWVVHSARGTRYFCPVSDCPHADVTQARGWGTLLGVRTHLREHFAGRFNGAVPQAFLDEHRLFSCSICGKLISQRYRVSCSSCHPTERAATTNNPTEANIQDSLPSLDDVCTTRVRILKFVPRGA